MTRRPKLGDLPPIPADVVAQLGTLSDRTLADRAGVGPAVIRAHREARKIAPAPGGRPPVTGTTRATRHYYSVTPAESLQIHAAIEIAQDTLSNIARRLMLEWAAQVTGLDAPTDPPTT